MKLQFQIDMSIQLLYHRTSPLVKCFARLDVTRWVLIQGGDLVWMTSLTLHGSKIQTRSTLSPSPPSLPWPPCLQLTASCSSAPARRNLPPAADLECISCFMTQRPLLTSTIISPLVIINLSFQLV